jgi:multicomponent Na+:H+ antiporter subunit B
VGIPGFGQSTHLYRDHSVLAALAHHTSNVVASVNFDQRGLDTLVEEAILLASVAGVAILLRAADDETARQPLHSGRILDATRLGGYLLLPVTLVIGFQVISEGSLTPGGGFQGGVVVGTGLHLLYVAGRYRSLERLRPVSLFEVGEAVGAAAFACLGVVGAAIGSAFLANVLPTGTTGELLSAGTVPLLNGAVGIEVASGTIVLLAKFLEQAIVIKEGGGHPRALGPGVAGATAPTTGPAGTGPAAASGAGREA